MSAHTSGSWAASDNTGPTMQSYSQPSCVTGTGPNRLKIIAGCFGDIGGPEVAGANARLIAAAPDLLKALQLFVKEQDEHQGLVSIDLYMLAIATIAKAVPP